MSYDRQDMYEQLPKDFREIFKSLHEDLVWLQCKWDFYTGLFGSLDNTRLLSHIAQTSFKIIEESLRADMTMTICRLRDPSQSRSGNKKFTNLSLETLINASGEIGNARAMLEDFRKVTQPIQTYRNKGVGHNDFNVAITPQSNPLAGIERSQIDKLMKSAWEILNIIYQHYVRDTELGSKVLVQSGADALLYWLRTAQQRQDNIKPAINNIL